MTRVGFVGLGKLGLPVATAMAIRGADVMGHDVDERRMSYAPQPYLETGPDGAGRFDDWLRKCDPKKSESSSVLGRLRFGTISETVAHAEILFVAVQTPHDQRFGGEAPLCDLPVDFDYSHLKAAVIAVREAKEDDRPLPLAVVSTVLPGTMEREVEPLLGRGLGLVYNPHFIAMGTTMRDFLEPEFVLLGGNDGWATRAVEEFYGALLPKCKAFSTLRIPGRAETEREWFEGPAVRRMSVASAELTKVAYNTFISTKIAVANALMEICHKTPGANVDDVTDALRAATKRVASGAYMTGGMGDGGGCHPRDNIALGWLARKLELSYDPFSAAMLAREAQSLWLVRVVFAEYLKAKAARIVVAGYAFKPGTNITAGSPALLFAAQLKEAFGVQAELWDPHVGAKQNEKRQGFHYRSNERVVLLVGCRHPEFKGWGGEGLALGSVVVDPHRTTGPSAPGVRVVRVGEGRG